MFKNSVCTSNKTQQFTTAKIIWLKLFKEIIAVCTENYMKPIHAELVIVKAGGTYKYRYTLKG
jgi:hypothetical protein